jgi:hypothetical protein
MADDYTPSRLDSLIAKKAHNFRPFLYPSFNLSQRHLHGAWGVLSSRIFTSFAASSERKNGSGQAFSLLSQDWVTTATRIYTRLSLALAMSSACSAVPDTRYPLGSFVGKKSFFSFHNSHMNGASSVYQRHLFLLCIACTKHTRKFSRPRLFLLLGFWLELLDASFHLTKDFVFFLLVVFSSTCNALLELLDNLEQ